MSRYWSELVNRLTPYVPGEQPRQEKLVKLNTNESPYPPTPAVLQAIAAVDGDDLRLYPDPESGALKEAFATRNNLQADQVFIGNGSDEVLAHCFQGLLKHDLPLYFPDVSYSFYPVWCDLYQIDYRQVPLSGDFTVDIAAYPEQNGGIIIPNPNAPTGVLLELDAVGELLRRSPYSVVVVDEAYIDFGGESAVRLIPEYDNLLVVQTLSKSRSLAGLRVGAAMGSVQLIEGLQRVKNSFNSYPLDVLAQRAALASLQDEAYFLDCCRRVMASREQLCAALHEMGFEVLPSSANFVFARHPQCAAQQLFAALRQRGILVRHFNKPRISQYLRISIGDEQACAVLVSALQEVLADASRA